MKILISVIMVLFVVAGSQAEEDQKDTEEYYKSLRKKEQAEAEERERIAHQEFIKERTEELKARGKAVDESAFLSTGSECRPIWWNGLCTFAYNDCNNPTMDDRRRESQCDTLQQACGDPLPGVCQAN